MHAVRTFWEEMQEGRGGGKGRRREMEDGEWKGPDSNKKHNQHPHTMGWHHAHCLGPPQASLVWMGAV